MHVKELSVKEWQDLGVLLEGFSLRLLFSGARLLGFFQVAKDGHHDAGEPLGFVCR